jgi:thiol-disulfide isomerase/thioredoxin
MQKSAYYDKRSDFWRHHWDIAQGYEDYLEGADKKHRERWRDSEARVPELSEGQKARLMGYGREMKVLVYSGIWCGDCARQGPMLYRIANACGDEVEIRFIERDSSEDLQDELRIVGALRVPVVVFLSKDFWEVARHGDRTLSVYRAKAARAIGKDFEAGILTPKAREREFSEWIDTFERVLLMLRLSPPLRRINGD